MKIRAAKPSEVAWIRSMHPGPEFDLSEWGEVDGSAWWVAVDGPALVGFCGARAVDDLAVREVALTSAWVDPAARGKGLQKRMIRTRVAWARANGASRVKTYTWGGNLPSMRALIATRFTPFRREWTGSRSYLYWSRELS